MDQPLSSNKDESLSETLKDSSHEEEEPPFFLNFPSPFLDDIYTPPMLPNYHQNRLNKDSNMIHTVTTNPACSQVKLAKKKRGGVKTDRHSKIHTAQGFRDRRMRLSLDIARQFFNLQDLLGFGKASETIDWLFSKSNEAIKEVTENFISQYSNQSMSEEMERSISPWSEREEESKGENLKGEITKQEARKRKPGNVLSRETRDKARARARERTRERKMIKDLEKSMQLFGGDPNDDFDKLGLGFSESPNNHNIEEFGVHQESVSPFLEHSHTLNLLKELQFANSAEEFEGCFGSSSTYSLIFDNHNNAAHEPLVGWPNSSNRF